MKRLIEKNFWTGKTQKEEIGGMPESINVFIGTGSISDAFEVHKELITTFQDDFSKYAPYADKNCLSDVFKNVARNIGNQIKYTRLSESFSSPTIKKAMAGVLCLQRSPKHKTPAHSLFFF